MLDQDTFTAVDNPWGLRGDGVRWRRDSIGMAAFLGSDRRGRGLEEYQEEFAMSPEWMRDKTILNMGAGPSVRFELESLSALCSFNEQVVGKTRFYSVSPDFAEPHHMDYARSEVESRTRAVREAVSLSAGFAQKTEFPDRMFDAIFLYHVLEHTNEHDAIYHELLRILKPGGRLYVGPFDVDVEVSKNTGPGFHPGNNSNILPDYRAVRLQGKSLRASFNATSERRFWEKGDYPNDFFYTATCRTCGYWKKK